MDVGQQLIEAAADEKDPFVAECLELMAVFEMGAEIFHGREKGLNDDENRDRNRYT